MSVIRTCCNKELNTTCIYGCITKHCTNEEEVRYRPLDGSCSGYVNRDLLRKQLTSFYENTNN
jgi:hypothetical protein